MIVRAYDAFETLGTYQDDIGNLRSHHWKHWLDLYTHCYYDCAYCVYRAATMGKVSAHPERLEALRRDLGRMERRGIVYLGPKADVYQPLDRKEQLARRALEIFLETKTPVFIVTRSELVLRDLDLLAQLAAEGLVEVSITVSSPQVIHRMEPHTLPPKERLALVRALRARGVATSVHMSPIIPELDDRAALLGLLDEIGDSGAECAYACMMGMGAAYYDTFARALDSVEPERKLRVMAAYPTDEAGPGVQSAPQAQIVDTMTALSQHATRRGIPFACVHIPPLDTVERNGGIFRFKLPTVGDLVRHCARHGTHEVRLPELLAHVRQFAAVDESFVATVERFWRAGTLFKNTHYHPQVEGEQIVAYRLADRLDLAITNMKVK